MTDQSYSRDDSLTINLVIVKEERAKEHVLSSSSSGEKVERESENDL